LQRTTKLRIWLSATVRVASRQVRWVLNLPRADNVLAIYPTLAEALSAAPPASSNNEQPEGG
jgi:hypothetical protein